MGGDRVNKFSFTLRATSSSSENLKVEFGVILFPLFKGSSFGCGVEDGSDLRDVI